MKSSLAITAVLLGLVLLGGSLSARATLRQSQRYESAAQELRLMVLESDWERAEAVLQAYRESWEKTESWMQLFVDHQDTDALSSAMEQVLAGIEAREPGLCLEGCLALGESAEHLYHRDALTWENVL